MREEAAWWEDVCTTRKLMRGACTLYNVHYTEKFGVGRTIYTFTIYTVYRGIREEGGASFKRSKF